MNFNEICRICLKTNKESYDIFTSYYSRRNTLYCEMLTQCTKLQPTQGDCLPRNICKVCCRQLKRAFSFSIHSLESDKILKQYLLDTSTAFGDSNHELCKNDKDIKDEIRYYGIEPATAEKLECEVDEIKLEENDINDESRDSWDDDDNTSLTHVKRQKYLQDSMCSNDANSCEVKEEKIKKMYKKKTIKSSIKPPLPDSKSPHQCDICGKFISTKSNLKAHKLSHTDLRPYKCNLCNSTFKGHSALFQHKRSHTGETPYHCEYCPKQFKRKTSLTNHIRIHTGEKMFSCDICFKTFVQSAQLSVHMRRHNGEKPFLCQDCGKGFPIRADLKVHQRVHNGEKPYPCSICPKTFATSGNLSIHVRIHNREIRYKCKDCGKGFVTCSAYKVHQKRHNGQRDYHCECGKTFYTSSALKTHRVVHTGEKNYQCKICDRKFSQTSHLNRHFKRDHAKLYLQSQYKVPENSIVGLNVARDSKEQATLNGASEASALR